MSPTAEQSTPDLLERVERLRPVLETHRDGAERARRPAPEVIAALRREGLFALLLPRHLGGLGAGPLEAVGVVEALARIDSAAAWNVNVAGSAAVLATRLPVSGRTRILGGGEPPPVMAAAAFPRCAATAVEGGLRVSGDVHFVSGCEDADWLQILVEVAGADPPPVPEGAGAPDIRAAFLPRGDVEVRDTWRTMGMRATGSHDIRVLGAFVPSDLAVSMAAPPVDPPEADAATLGVFPWQVIHGEAVVSLGLAAAALEAAANIAVSKLPANAAQTTAERELTQLNLGRARALIESGRAYLYDTLGTAVLAAATGAPLETQIRVSLQLAACRAAESGAAAVQLLYDSLGSTAFLDDAGIERHLRDARVLTQHAAKSNARYVSAGRVMLGMAPDTTLLR